MTSSTTYTANLLYLKELKSLPVRLMKSNGRVPNGLESWRLRLACLHLSSPSLSLAAFIFLGCWHVVGVYIPLYSSRLVIWSMIASFRGPEQAAMTVATSTTDPQPSKRKTNH